MRCKVQCIALIVVALSTPETPAVAQDITFSGQVRPRLELTDLEGGGKDSFTSMRVRASLNAVLDRDVRVFVQLQDVRLLGEEASTLGDFSADNLDLHQGYIEVSRSKFRIRVGREEINLGGQRLIGAVGWTQQGRAFDGARLVARTDNVSVNVLGYRLQEGSSATHDQDAVIMGAYGELENTAAGSLDVYGFYNLTGILGEVDQGTVGARLHRDESRIRYRLEGSYQFGSRNSEDVAAFMVGGRIGVTHGKGSVTLWYDYLSGDDDSNDAKTKVFDTLFATNHKFYGIADLFLNIPVHTGALGLQDAAVKFSYRPFADWTTNLDVHAFFTAKQGQLTTSRLAEEIDVTLSHRYSAGLGVSGGVSYVLAEDGLSELGRLNQNMLYTYVMLNATF